jgi:probable F420-dependent oxidoreductase
MEFWQAVAFLESEQLLDVARSAEELGFDAITISDHIFYPAQLESKYPYMPDGVPFWSPETPWPDAWVTISAMAAVTSRIRFTTNIYVAPARDLFTVAKLVSTASVLSNERVSLGAAPGWCKEEFDQLGQDFATRGPRLEEMVSALRTLWKGGNVEHHGRFYDVPTLQIAPVPKNPIPIYLGGDTNVALRRAAAIADGWIGNAYSAGDAEAVLQRLDAELKAAGRTKVPFHKVIALLDPPSVDLYRHFEGLGVTALVCAPWMVASVEAGSFRSPLAAKIEAMTDFAETIIHPMKKK